MKFSRRSLTPSSDRLGEPEGDDLSYFFLDRDAEHDPAVKQLQDALVRNLPSIRDRIRRVFGDDSVLQDYVDRLYNRLRKALKSTTEVNDAAISSRLISIIHEDRRRNQKRFIGTPEVVHREDPRSLDFVTDLVRRDQLRAFRECLDEWTRQVFDLRFSTTHPVEPKELARRFGMKRNSFDQRWKRGIDAGIVEYRRRHNA